jgi:Flp pilus assembly pilin Flp
MKVQRLAEGQSTPKVNMMIQKLLFRAELLRRDVRGQDLVEYALLAGFVAVAAGAIFPTTIAPNISQIFSRISSTLNRA